MKKLGIADTRSHNLFVGAKSLTKSVGFAKNTLKPTNDFAG